MPTWPTDRWRRQLGATAPPADRPLVLLDRDGRRRVVTAVNSAARALGLRPGMPATQAHILVPDLLTHPAEPEADEAALHRLALWALKHYSPVVAPAPPDGLLIDATGASHLAGGAPALLADLVARLAAVGIQARAAMAPSIGAAHALARTRANPTLIAGTDALADLPIAALRLSAETVRALKRVGLERIGALDAAPRAPLALRYGAEPGRRLD